MGSVGGSYQLIRGGGGLRVNSPHTRPPFPRKLVENNEIFLTSVHIKRCYLIWECMDPILSLSCKLPTSAGTKWEIPRHFYLILRHFLSHCAPFFSGATSLMLHLPHHSSWSFHVILMNCAVISSLALLCHLSPFFIISVIGLICYELTFLRKNSLSCIFGLVSAITNLAIKKKLPTVSRQSCMVKLRALRFFCSFF